MLNDQSTQASDKPTMDTIVIEKRRKLPIPKDLNIVSCWDIIGPVLAEEFGEGYSHIPYCLDMDAYKIGHIFITIEQEVKCFRSRDVVKIIGPISSFVLRDKTNTKFLNPQIDPIQRQPDVPHIKLKLINGDRQLIFTGYNCLFLDRPRDMFTEGNVTIDRTSYAGLCSAKQFGFITGVFVARSFRLQIERGKRTRVMYIGEGMHTVLFRYEICEMNEFGFVTKTSQKKTDFRWASIMEQPRDTLPLPKFATITDS